MFLVSHSPLTTVNYNIICSFHLENSLIWNWQETVFFPSKMGQVIIRGHNFTNLKKIWDSVSYSYESAIFYREVPRLWRARVQLIMIYDIKVISLVGLLVRYPESYHNICTLRSKDQLINRICEDDKNCTKDNVQWKSTKCQLL